MTDFIAAVGLVFVIEGLLWSLAPGLAIRLLVEAANTPLQTLRIFGAIAVALGVGIVWAVRG